MVDDCRRDRGHGACSADDQHALFPRLRIQHAYSRYEMAVVSEIYAVDAEADAGALQGVVLLLERAARVDEYAGSGRGDCGGIGHCCIDPRVADVSGGEARQLLRFAAGGRAVAPGDHHLDAGGAQQPHGDAPAEISIAAEHQHFRRRRLLPVSGRHGDR